MLFFDSNENFDIIHIHWPEAFVGWKMVDSEKFDRIMERLDIWKNRAKVIYTRHNEEAHELPYSSMQSLYNKVLDSCSGVIHLTTYSFENIKEDLTDKIIHTVIPHGAYRYSNDIPKPDAREKLKIPEKKFVILVFGKIRNESEKQFLLKGIKSLKRDYLFIAPRWKHAIYPSFKTHPMRRIISVLRDFFLDLFNSKFRISDGFVSNEDVQVYMNAADVVLVPRVNTLNSGVLFLGLSFNKVVIGIDKGGVGEVLREHNFPTFDPEHFQSLSKALEQGYVLSRKEIRGAMEWSSRYNWNSIAESHLEFYHQLLTSEK